MPAAIRVLKGRGLAALLRNLTADRLAWVTGGRKPEAPTWGDRHNLLATELGLKLAEHAPVAAVLGPRDAAHHDLDVTGRTAPSRRAADLVVVFDSGMVIAAEISAIANPHSLRKKIVTWIELLARAPHDDMGLRVLFLDVADPVRHSPNQIWTPLTRILDEELCSRPSAIALGVNDRIVVSRWQQWLPLGGAPTLDLNRMLTLRWHEGTWTYSCLRKGLDAFTPRRPELFASVAPAATQLAACPAVLRADRPSVSESLHR